MPTVTDRLKEEARRKTEQKAAETTIENQPGPTTAKADLARTRRVENYRRELMDRQSQRAGGGVIDAPVFEHGATLGLDVPLSGVAAALDFWNGGDTSMSERYEAGEAARRARLGRAKAEAVVPATLQEMAGSIVGLPPAGAAGAWRAGTAVPVAEQTAARTALESGGFGATTGAIHGVATGEGSLKDRLMRGVTEGAVSGVASGLLGGALAKGGNAADYLRAPPESRAAQAIYELAQRNELTPQAIQDAITRYGPETMAIDLLGESGRGAARSAANISPEARETMTTALAGRKAGQNQRLVSDVQQAAGVPVGDRRTVQDIVDQSYEARRPTIDAAYDAARLAGQELPREPFLPILETPMGRQAYESALPSLANRKAIQGPQGGVAGALARLDQTKIELDAIAQVARRQGDNNRAAQAEGLARLLRQRIDEVLDDPLYAEARAARAAAFREQEAIETGSELATRPGIGGAAAASQYTGDPAQLAGLRAGYAQETADRLLSRNSGASSLNEMSTPLATETRNVVLGPEAPTIENALARERQFNLGERAVTGNSTTVRQLLESGMAGGGLGGLGGAILSHLTGGSSLSPMALGTAALGAGASAIGTTLIPALQRRLAQPVATAAEVGRILSGGPGGIPLQRAIEPGFISRLAASAAPMLSRIGSQFTFPDAPPAPVEPTPAPQQQGALQPLTDDPLDQRRQVAGLPLPDMLAGLVGRRMGRV